MSDDTVRFASLLQALEPHLGSLVIAGGWATRLYRLHDRVMAVSFDALLTDDADIALPENMAEDSPSIHDSLISAGFEEVMGGKSSPPVTHYVTPEGDFEVEFITHQRGGPESRAGQNVTALVGGVTAQRLGKGPRTYCTSTTLSICLQMSLTSSGTPGTECACTWANPSRKRSAAGGRTSKLIHSCFSAPQRSLRIPAENPLPRRNESKPPASRAYRKCS